MVFVAIFVAFFSLLLLTKYYENQFYRIAALLGFFGHVFLSLVIIPRLPYRWDIGEFHQTATEITTGTFTGGSVTVSSFGSFQALLYTVFTPQPEVLGVFNGLFAVLTVIPVVYLSNMLYPNLPQNNHAVIFTITFLPLPFLFLSIPMRDALTVLLFFTLLSVGLAALKSHRPETAVTVVPLWGMLYLLRPELALIIALGLTSGVIVKVVRDAKDDLSLTSLTIIFGSIGALGFGLFAEVLYSFERANAQMTGRASGGAVYLDGMEYTSWFDFLLAAPARGVYFQFAPFPLHVESLFHLLGFSASLLVIILFVAAIRSLYQCTTDETTMIFLVVIYVAGIIGYGTINSNFGTNVRHRIVFDFMLILFAVPVIQRWELLLREWLGIVPGQRDENDEQQRETEELDRGLHVGGQHTEEAR